MQKQSALYPKTQSMSNRLEDFCVHCPMVDERRCFTTGHHCFEAPVTSALGRTEMSAWPGLCVSFEAAPIDPFDDGKVSTFDAVLYL